MLVYFVMKSLVGMAHKVRRIDAPAWTGQVVAKNFDFCSVAGPSFFTATRTCCPAIAPVRLLAVRTFSVNVYLRLPIEFSK
jgi:hypothetical protein